MSTIIIITPPPPPPPPGGGGTKPKRLMQSADTTVIEVDILDNATVIETLYAAISLLEAEDPEAE